MFHQKGYKDDKQAHEKVFLINHRELYIETIIRYYHAPITIKIEITPSAGESAE